MRLKLHAMIKTCGINSRQVLDVDNEKISIYLTILYPSSDNPIIWKAHFNLK
jgi:hypothetical protein